MPENQSVTVEIVGAGDRYSVQWSEGLTARQALELVAAQVGAAEKFTFGLQYYGRQKAYLLLMLNETYDTFGSSSDPSFYWRFYVNGEPADNGIDGTVLRSGDAVRFSLETYDASQHGGTELQIKHAARQRT